MKHIKKRFQFEKVLSQQEIDNLSLSPDLIPFKTSSNVKIPKDKSCLLITDKNEVFTAFQVSHRENCYLIPEPDPVLIYFNNAYFNYKDIEKEKDTLLCTGITAR